MAGLRFGLVAALLLAGSGAEAQGWTFRTVEMDGGARGGGRIEQAEAAGAGGHRLIVGCGFDGQPWVTFRFGGADPQWPGASVAMWAHVETADGRLVSFDLGTMGYSLSAYAAPAPAGLVPALMNGRSVTLESPPLAFDTLIGLSGSSRAIGRLQCI